MIFIELIIHWVTQIIIFLLLASVVDMLIPTSSLKKYIKLVVGLLLILIFLKPVFYIFNIDLENAVTSTFADRTDMEIEDESIENLIKKQKTEIEVSQDAYILKEMTLQLSNIAKELLLKNHNVEIVDMEYVFMSLSEGVTYENLDEVIVYIDNATGEEGIVDRVDEVNINTKTPRRKVEKDTDQIAVLLAEVWELTDKTIKIEWRGGTS